MNFTILLGEIETKRLATIILYTNRFTFLSRTYTFSNSLYGGGGGRNYLKHAVENDKNIEPKT